MVDLSDIRDPQEETVSALERVQKFDVKSLVRAEELGQKLALSDLVEPLKEVQALFLLIAPEHIHFFPEQQRTVIRNQANAFYSFLEQCLNFDIENSEANPTNAKEALVSKANGLYQGYFDQLYPLISFATARTQDFSRLERDARAASQQAKDAATEVLSELEEQRKAADVILSEVRASAAEQGVSRQAIHFKTEADLHKTSATEWMKYTIGSAIILVVYSIASLFIHNIPGLDSDQPYRAAQLAVSKVLIFAVFAYLLILSARNFLSHRHNEIVNRHRQNALATFTALAEATSDAASSDIVLSHAAACIFSPQETGLTKQDAPSSDSVPSFQIVPRIGNLGGGLNN